MAEKLVKVRNESGAEFIVPESHYYSYKKQHKLTLLGVFLSEATQDLSVIKKTLSYLDAMFPAGILQIQIANDVQETYKKFIEHELRELKKTRYERIGEISNPYYEICDESCVVKPHLFIATVPNQSQLAIRRGGILLLMKDGNYEDGFPKSVWEAIDLTEQEKTSGMTLFRKFV